MLRSAGQIFDVFSPTDIQKLIFALSKVKDQCLYKNQIYTNGFRNGDLIYPMIKKIVIDRLATISPVSVGELTVGMQLKARTPFGIHTDYQKDGDDGGGLAWLIPLYCKSHNPKSMTSTIIFDQYYDSQISMLDYVHMDPERPKNSARDIWHLLPSPYREQENLSDFFSVKIFADWIPGSAIYWDRSLFHCSDDFQLHGIEEKSALVLFTH